MTGNTGRPVFIVWDNTAIKWVEYADVDPVQPDIFIPPRVPSHKLGPLGRAAQAREAKAEMLRRIADRKHP